MTKAKVELYNGIKLETAQVKRIEDALAYLELTALDRFKAFYSIGEVANVAHKAVKADNKAYGKWLNATFGDGKEVRRRLSRKDVKACRDIASYGEYSLDWFTNNESDSRAASAQGFARAIKAAKLADAKVEAANATINTVAALQAEAEAAEAAKAAKAEAKAAKAAAAKAKTKAAKAKAAKAAKAAAAKAEAAAEAAEAANGEVAAANSAKKAAKKAVEALTPKKRPTGKSDSPKGILGLLERIESDLIQVVDFLDSDKFRADVALKALRILKGGTDGVRLTLKENKVDYKSAINS